MFIKVEWVHCNVTYVTFNATPFKITEILLNNFFDNFKDNFQVLNTPSKKTSDGPLYSCKQFVCITNTLRVVNCSNMMTHSKKFIL